jgi:hypothetical protein
MGSTPNVHSESTKAPIAQHSVICTPDGASRSAQKVYFVWPCSPPNTMTLSGPTR